MAQFDPRENHFQGGNVAPSVVQSDSSIMLYSLEGQNNAGANGINSRPMESIEY